MGSSRRFLQFTEKRSISNAEIEYKRVRKRRQTPTNIRQKIERIISLKGNSNHRKNCNTKKFFRISTVIFQFIMFYE